MTLIVSVNYREGNILASDTRVMWGLRKKKDGQTKVIKVNGEVALAAAGLVGAIEDIKEELLLRYSKVNASFDEVVETLSKLVYSWWDANKMKFEGQEQGGPDFALATKDRMRIVFGSGYSEEVRDYHCEGSGSNYGDFLMQNAYSPGLDCERAKELAIYTIVETSKVDPTVGDEISMIICDRKKGLVEVPKAEIEEIASQFPRNIFAIKTEAQKAEKIVSLRDEINSLFDLKFGFKLFFLQEKPILKLHESCKNEKEFSLLISSLGILVDELDNESMKKHVANAPNDIKSIGLLNEFLKAKGVSEPKTCTDAFGKIRILRSAHFPIHTTESHFIQLVIDLVEKFPPDWRKLWVQALDLYVISLSSILKWVKEYEI